MRKYFLILSALTFCFISCLPASSKEEEKEGFSVGAQLGVQLPIGDFSDNISPGFSFQALYMHKMEENLDIRFTLGYIKFGSKDNGIITDYNLSDFLINAGVHYKIEMEPLRPYIGAELGYHLISYSFNHSQLTTIEDTESKFGLGIFGGVIYTINEDWSLFGDLKYTTDFTDNRKLNYIGINACIKYEF